MVALGLKLIGIGNWLKEAVRAAFRWCLARPWQAALIAALALSLWLYHGKQSETRRADAWHHAWQAQKNASEAAAAAQKALNAKIQTTYKEAANVAQERYVALSDRSGDLTRDYIAAHRVRPSTGQACGSDPAAPAGDPGVPAPVPAQAVLVDESDVRACSDAYAYALSAHQLSDEWLKAGAAR